jgi:uncharacterized repeat protein (TIGR02543 family)
MKKICLFILVLFCGLSLLGCKKANNEDGLIKDLVDALTIGFGAGDTALSVTKNLTLQPSVIVNDGDESVTVAVNWTSSDASVSSLGVVTRPADANVNVTLNASVTYKTSTASKKFYIVVIKQGGIIVPPEVEYYHYEYTGGTTTNFVQGNNANLVGLPAGDFNVTGNELENGDYAPQAIGLNKDGSTRLYYKATGQGNILTINSLISDIDHIVISLGVKNEGTVSYKVNGSTKSVTGTYFKDQASVATYDIKSPNLTIQNTNTTNNQLYIWSIDIYLGSGGGVIVPPETDNYHFEYTGSTTTSFSQGNNASLVGLPASEFNVTGNILENGEYDPLSIGLNKDGSTRLYFKESGEGSILTIAYNSGSIKNITMSLGVKNAGTVNYKVNGSSKSVTGTFSESGAVSASYDINSPTLTIQNTNTTSNQLYIWSIDIYVEGGTVVPPNPNQYTLTLVYGNGSANGNIVSSGVITSIPTPTYAGHTFLGWYTQSNFSGSAITFPFTISANTTIYAKWEESGSSGETATYTLDYPTGNATGELSVSGNNASALGLNPSSFNVTASKGTSSSAPGVNENGSIRLYYDPSGNGNSISVTSSVGTITSIAVSLGAKETSAISFSVNGQSQSLTLSKPESSATLKTYTIDSNTFTIKNTNSSNNNQLYIWSIVITINGTGGGVIPPTPATQAPNDPHTYASWSAFLVDLGAYLGVDLSDLPEPPAYDDSESYDWVLYDPDYEGSFGFDLYTISAPTATMAQNYIDLLTSLGFDYYDGASDSPDGSYYVYVEYDLEYPDVLYIEISAYI